MTETTLKKLKSLKASGAFQENIKNYILWQLSAMVNEELAEVTANELIDKKLSISGAAGAVQTSAKAKSGICSDVDGYKIVREYLHIDGVVTDAEAALFFLKDIPKETILDLIGKVKRDAPEVTKPMLDLDIDGLFD